MERDTRLQGIFAYLSKPPLKIPLNKKSFFLLSKALRKERPSMFPQSGALLKQTPISRALLNISFAFPSKGTLPPGPLYGVPRREMPIPRALLHSSFSPRYTGPLLDSRFPSAVKGPIWREMPVSRAFLNISSRVPTKGASPLEALSTELL